MSSIVIDFPDCAKLGSSDPGTSRDNPNGHDTITVYTEGCPAPITESTYVETMFSTWQFILMAAIVLTAVVATAMVRFRRHERLEAERKAELSVRHTHCPTCGDRYVPAK